MTIIEIILRRDPKRLVRNASYSYIFVHVSLIIKITPDKIIENSIVSINGDMT